MESLKSDVRALTEFNGMNMGLSELIVCVLLLLAATSTDQKVSSKSVTNP